MKKPIILGVALALAAAATGIILWRGHQPFYYAGTVEAQEVDVASGLASPIARIHVKEGQKVAQGEPLVDLDCREVRLAAALAKDELARAQRLLKDGTLPQSQFDRALYARDDAAVRASWCQVASPLTATVLQLFQQEGEWSRPGGRLISLADLDHLYAWVYVGQAALSGLRPGQAYSVKVPDAQGRTLTARVAFIRPEAEFTPKNVQTREERERLVHGVKLDLGDGGGLLVPGMSIETALGD